MVLKSVDQSQLSRAEKLACLVILQTLLLGLTGCGRAGDQSAGLQLDHQAPLIETTANLSGRRSSKHLKQLSQYQLFQGQIAELEPASNVIEYEVNTPLFSDYSAKQRLVRLPPGTSANYHPVDAFEFPVGTVLAKTFYYWNDFRDASQGRRIIETRIMLREANGWVGLPYVWNADQSDAELSVAGAVQEVQWLHADGETRNNLHLVPNLNDCKRCHLLDSMVPIGLTARNLNRQFEYDGTNENQLARWSELGILAGAPPPAEAPRLAVWDNPNSGSIDARARAWLEVNCAHCHNPKGPARNSGLHLTADVSDPYQLGVFKTPVAAGKGTGGRLYSIVPGKPEESIMLFRLETTHSGSMMPEFGRSLVHKESVALIREWIAGLDTPQ
jgi:uncharacterized repeat protein (TIGR03806 family)